MKIRRSQERGVTELGWLHSKHTFSFGDYYDPAHMGYRSLRVINDDIIEAGQGFGTHPHRDMEIITIMVEGSLAHKDSLGHGEALKPGEVQVMSAGRLIQHSEFNASQTERAHLIQIWILPERKGLPSAYAQQPFNPEDKRNKLLRVAGPERENNNGALKINQDAHVYLLDIENGNVVTHDLKEGRGAWIHLIRGQAVVNEESLESGDAISVEGPSAFTIRGTEGKAEFLIFDLA